MLRLQSVNCLMACGKKLLYILVVFDLMVVNKESKVCGLVESAAVQSISGKACVWHMYLYAQTWYSV